MDVNLKKGTKLFIVGDIHEHKPQFIDLVNIIQPSKERILVSVGDIFDRGLGKKAAKDILNKMIHLYYNGCCYMVRGNHEQKLLNKNESLSGEEEWATTRPLSIRFKFHNQSSVLVMHGGITQFHNWGDLESNTDVLYTRKIDERGKKIRMVKQESGEYIAKKPGKSWHEYYDGRFGYIVAGHDPQKNGEVAFYKYSCNVDTGCFETGVLSAVVVDEFGVQETIQVKGKSFWR